MIAIVKQLGFEWVTCGDRYWEGGSGDGRMTPFSGAVAIQSNVGWLLLARVEEITREGFTAEIRRVGVEPKELHSLDRMPYWPEVNP